MVVFFVVFVLQSISKLIKIHNPPHFHIYFLTPENTVMLCVFSCFCTYYIHPKLENETSICSLFSTKRRTCFNRYVRCGYKMSPFINYRVNYC